MNSLVTQISKFSFKELVLLARKCAICRQVIRLLKIQDCCFLLKKQMLSSEETNSLYHSIKKQHCNVFSKHMQ